MTENRMLRLLLVDDDEVSREVLAMLAEAEGYEVAAVESGDAALLWLSNGRVNAVLTDLQMPGLSGDALARALRSACGDDVVLLAMSGSKPQPEAICNYDGFLLKPFEMDELAAAIAQRSVVARDEVLGAVVMDPAVLTRLRQMMKPEQVRGLFDMFLGDAEKRIVAMRQAIADDDDVAFKGSAHALKGGCGMVGAAEMHGLARELEETGLGNGSLDSLSVLARALERLRGMLVASVT